MRPSLSLQPCARKENVFFEGKATQQKYPHGVTMNTEYKHLVISFIFAEIYIYTLYLNSLATVKKTKHKQKRTKKAQIQQQLSQKYKTDESARRCSVFCTKYYTCTTKYKGNKHEGKYIHIINYVFFVKFKKNSSILFLQTVLTCPNCNVYNFSYIKKKHKGISK